VHEEKQLSQRTLTDEGRQMDESDEQLENANASIREKPEPSSNATVEREGQEEKQRRQRTSIDDGMQHRRKGRPPG
jgi:hypothetical protein